MAGTYGPSSGIFLVEGYNLLASKIEGMRDKVMSSWVDALGVGDTWRERVPTGKKSVELAQEGAFFDTATGASHAALQSSLPGDPQTSPRVACIGYAGQTKGSPFVGLNGPFTVSYEVIVPAGADDDIERANAEYECSGERNDGIILQELADKTANWDTQSASADYTEDTRQQVVPITSNSQANPTVVTTPIDHNLVSGDKVLIAGVAGSSPDINGEQVVTVISDTTFSVPVDTSAGSAGTGGTFVRADSADGAVGYLQVLAVDGFTNVVVKIQDSLDNAAWADLMTFADNVSAPFAEVVAVSGDVDRHTSVDGVITGSGSVSVFCGLARNPRS